MQNYIIQYNNTIGYIYSTSFYSPIDFILDIENELKNNNFCGDIYFDLLLSNGNTYNRIVKAYFDGQYFDRSSFILIENNQEIKQRSANFYKENISILENGILSKPLIFMIKKGVAI